MSGELGAVHDFRRDHIDAQTRSYTRNVIRGKSKKGRPGHSSRRFTRLRAATHPFSINPHTAQSMNQPQVAQKEDLVPEGNANASPNTT